VPTVRLLARSDDDHPGRDQVFAPDVSAVENASQAVAAYAERLAASSGLSRAVIMAVVGDELRQRATKIGIYEKCSSTTHKAAGRPRSGSREDRRSAQCSSHSSSLHWCS
jgi:hypothetical protein